LAEWDITFYYSIEIEGYGTLWELIYAYIYCENNGIGHGDFTASTEAPTTTTSVCFFNSGLLILLQPFADLDKH
jgi:hypothetical protein